MEIMEPLRGKATRSEPSAAVIEASLWLRLGFFGGASIVVVALIRLIEGEAELLLPLASFVVGAALAAFSVRRALHLFNREDGGLDEPASASRGVLSKC